MKRALPLCFALFYLLSCKNKVEHKIQGAPDSSLVNTKHLDALYTPVTFPSGAKAAGIYIYSEAPDYHLVAAKDEGFTCVDDVSRAALVYARSRNILADSVSQHKLLNLVKFILQMQSGNGYFYNFLLPGNTINKEGKTSINSANWWSWRAFQTLTEVSAIIRKIDTLTAYKIDISVNRILNNIISDIIKAKLKDDLFEVFPKWLPSGSGTDQAAILIFALINYCSVNNNDDLKNHIVELANGIVSMQRGDVRHFPYCCFLSWENVWHAYGCDQAYSLLKAGEFLNDSNYILKALAEVDNFYPWLLKNGMRSSFSILKSNNEYLPFEVLEFPQIAYGIRPMIFAATEAYKITGNKKYVDIAAQLAAWFLGVNDANTIMYDKNSGRCFDGIIGINKVNRNSGAESTIEALLAMQRIEEFPEVIPLLKKYMIR